MRTTILFGCFKGFSALHCAAGQGKIGIVRMLLNYNANPDLQTRDGFTALMLTGHSTRAWPEVADALLKAGANPNIRGLFHPNHGKNLLQLYFQI